MTVRSKVLGAVLCGSASTTTVYTVPAGRTALVKHVSLYTGTGVTAMMRWTANGVTAYWAIQTLAAGNSTFFLPNAALGPGDDFRCRVLGATDTAVVVASGAELQGVAP